MSRQRLTLQAFKDLAKSGETPDAVIAKGCALVVKAIDGEDCVREFRASDGTIDRDGDSIDQAGWELDDFRKGGSFLWAHDASLPPIGAPTSVFVEGTELRLRVKFPGVDMPHPMGAGFGHTVMRMFDEGLLRGVSVGFIPLEWAYNEARGPFSMDFKRQTLLEVSATPVPSNPNALHIARSKGIDVAPLVNWCEEMVSKDLLWIPKSALKEILDNEAKPSVSVPRAYGDVIRDAEEAEAQAVADVAAFLDGVVKRGRMLSKTNEGALIETLANALEVLAGDEDEDPEAVEAAPEAPEVEADFSDFEILDDLETTPTDAIVMSADEFTAFVRDLTADLSKKIHGETIAQLTGRLPV